MRSALIIAHTVRYEITCLAADAAQQLRAAGFEVRMLASEASECRCDNEATVVPDEGAAEGAEIVLHQAALGSVPRSIRDPLATHRANATGFLNMLVAARDAGVRRFVYAA